MATTPFNVIKGHRFRYQSKANKQLPISDLKYCLAPFPSYDRLLVKFSLAMGVLHFNAFAGADPLRISGKSVPLQKLE